MLTRALLAALGVCLVAVVWQHSQLTTARAALVTLQGAITTAQQQARERAATTGLEAVTDYVEAQTQSAPVAAGVADRVRNICVRQPAADHLPVPATAESIGQARRQAQDDADRAAFLSAVAEDLQTCVSELNRLDAIRNYHNANVGPAR